MFNFLKKGCSFLCALALTTNMFLTASANDIEKNATNEDVAIGAVSARMYNSYNGYNSLKDVLGDKLDAFHEHIVKNISDCRKSIDISGFGIYYTPEVLDDLAEYIFDEIPQSFHFSEFTPYLNYKDEISKIEIEYFDYADTAAEYKQLITACESVATQILDGIIDNDNLNDAEKALLIHDRLALVCEYDFALVEEGIFDPIDKGFNMYGALVEGEAVCQGYAEAYDYLLDKVGIKSYLCSSDELFHVWNILEIDGKLYHADVTWDDGYSNGSVTHNYFLQSSETWYNGVNGSVGHVATDYETCPNDTKYDDYYWQSSTTAFQLIDDELYYFDNNKGKLIRESDGKELCSVSDTWNSAFGYWEGNYSKLSSDGSDLLYTDIKNVYAFDLETMTSKIILTPDLSVGNNYSIFGMIYENGYITVDLFNSPNRDSNNKMKHEVMYYEPSANLTAGDVDGNGEVNLIDVTIIRRVIVELRDMDFPLSAGDFDGNGNLNLIDTTLMRRYIVGNQ